MKRKQNYSSAGSRNSEKRKKQPSKINVLLNFEEKTANFNEDVLGIVFNFLDFEHLITKCRYVCLQWNEAFCSMPVLSSRVKAPLSSEFERKANMGELYMIRNLSLAGVEKDFDVSLLPKLEHLKLISHNPFLLAPSSIKSLSNLKSLELHGFDVTGKLIQSWRELSKLEDLIVKHISEFYEFKAYNGLSVKRLEVTLKNEFYAQYTDIFNGNISKTLTHLSLCSYGKISLLTPLPNLTVLELEYCDIVGVDVKNLPMLSEIIFNGVFNPKGSESIFTLPTLKKMLIKSTSIDRNIKAMTGNGLDELGLADLGKGLFRGPILEKFKNLKKLDVSNSVLGNTKEFSLFKQLTELNVKSCIIGAQVLKSISKMPQLTSLNIGCNDIKSNVFIYLKKLVNLTYLDLEDCGIKDIEPITKYIKLTTLNLKNNYLKGDWLNNLTYLSELKKLNLEGNELKALEPISYLKNITSLKLKSLKFSDIQESELKHLIKLEYLKKLSINSMDIGKEGAKTLGSGKFNHLQLNVCELTDKMIPHIIKNTHLRYLKLQKNNITDKGVKTIIEAYLPFMKELEVADNKVSPSVNSSKFKIHHGVDEGRVLDFLFF